MITHLYPGLLLDLNSRGIEKPGYYAFPTTILIIDIIKKFYDSQTNQFAWEVNAVNLALGKMSYCCIYQSRWNVIS